MLYSIWSAHGNEFLILNFSNFFARIRSGNFDNNDKDRSRIGAEADYEKLAEILRNSARDLAIELAVL